jgi:hypothetical protein
MCRYAECHYAECRGAVKNTLAYLTLILITALKVLYHRPKGLELGCLKEMCQPILPQSNMYVQGLELTLIVDPYHLSQILYKGGVASSKNTPSYFIVHINYCAKFYNIGPKDYGLDV